MPGKKIAGLGAAAAVLVAVAVMVISGGDSREATAEPTSAKTATARVINVEVEPVEPATFVERVRVTGVAEAERDVTLAAEESGIIRRLFVAKGERVKAGQPIAKIDDELLRAQAEQAEAQARLAEETFERQRRLWEDEQIGSEMAFLQSKYAAQQARASARALAERLRRTVVRAPIDGVLDERMVEVGSMVAPGSPVARVVDVDPIEVVAGVPERYAGQLRRGAGARIAFDALGGSPVEGVVSFVGASLQTDNRTVPIEIRVPNPDRRIHPGLVATVSVEMQRLEDALTVPRQAVLRSADGYVVYVAAESGGVTLAEARPVVTGPGDEGRILVRSGLRAGDRVVIVGQERLTGGDVLSVVAERDGGGR